MENVIATLQQLKMEMEMLRAQKARKNEYMRQYMKEYSKTHKRVLTEEQKCRNIASALKISYEEYMARKEAGLIKRGRPRKIVATV